MRNITIEITRKPSKITQIMRSGKIARLRADWTNPKWGYQSRAPIGEQENPPHTFTFNENMSDLKGSKIPLTFAMNEYGKRLNGDNWNKILIPAAGWINTGTNPEALSWACNDVIVLGRVGRYVNIFALDCYATDLQETYFSKNGRLVVHKFNAITPQNTLIKLGAGYDLYTPFIKNSPSYWTPFECVEMWPDLPCVVTAGGQSWTVTEYELLGHETWGLTDTGRVCLYNGEYLTDWRLDNPMPPV